MPEVRILYFARHGETDWNAEGRLQGHTDVPLNAAGRAQALALARALRGTQIVAVGASDLARARVTAEIAARELGVPLLLTDPAFRERAYGVFEGRTHDECHAHDPLEWARFLDARATPPGGESLEAVTERMWNGALRAAATLPGNALIVSHGRSLRELASAVRKAQVAPIPNGAGYRFVIEDGRFVSAEPLVP